MHSHKIGDERVINVSEKDKNSSDFISLEDIGLDVEESQTTSHSKAHKPPATSQSHDEFISLDNLDTPLDASEGARKPKTQKLNTDQIQSIDDLLLKEDPSFSATLQVINKDLDQNQTPIASINLDSVLEGVITTSEVVPKEKLHKILSKRIKSLFYSIKDKKRKLSHFIRSSYLKIQSHIIKEVLHFIKVGHKDVLNIIQKKNKIILSKVKDLFNKLSSFSKIEMILLISIPLLILGAFFLYKKSTNGGWMPSAYEPYLKSFDKVASQIYYYQANEPTEPFDSPLRHPEYIVLFDKMVVNLRRPYRSGTNPMGAFEIYLEGSSNEAGIELMNRKKEFLDVIQRTIESYTYEELDSLSGKQKLKLHIRKQINYLLNNGWVKKVYFKTIIIKP